MNLIVSNKQKNILDSANIDVIKDLNGLFEIDELINNCKGYIFNKIIIDATSIVDFAKEDVLRKLASGIDVEKILLLLPEKPQPPQRFCDFLISLGIKRFATNINDIIDFLKNSDSDTALDNNIYNTSVSDNSFMNQNNNMNNQISNNATNINNDVNDNENVNDTNNDQKIVLGFKNVTLHAGSTTLIYMIKQQLEKKYQVNVEAYEVGNNDFKFFNTTNMHEANVGNIEQFIRNSKSDIILLDINNNANVEYLCDDIIYLVEPSILKINKLLNMRRDIFISLNNKKVILNKSVLTSDEVSIFGKEAGIKIYFNIPYVNDRVDNQIINDFINKLGIINNGGQNLFGIFN